MPVSEVAPTDLPLVVIGASAGGLDPLEQFFEATPDDCGWAFVVIQHLSPEYRSRMDELLARKSRLRIKHIEAGLRLEPNTIYLNQPSVAVELVDDAFVTHEFTDEDELPRLSIDSFFRSVANRRNGRTVGIIMSGSGSDGSRGTVLLREAGAVVLAQLPTEAGFNSMPMAAIAAGSVDRVLTARDMPAAIKTIFESGKLEQLHPSGEKESIAQILQRLEERYQVDFSAFKTANVQRRIERRQHLRSIPDIASYAALLMSDEDALDELYRDLLIGVTQFFRDAEAFMSLRENVLDPLLRENASEAPLRIWVPACATGEEAYSIAIALSETMAKLGIYRKFRIIATDVHRGSLERASSGIYSENAVSKLPPEIVKRYFERRGGSYEIDPVLRQKMIFSSHDVLSDPPFMNIDLISCRNLFIYFREEPQVRVLSMFLFGLRPNGYLMLGSSESLGRFADEFKTVDGRWRIYRKNTHKRFFDRSMLTARARTPKPMEPLKAPRTPPDVVHQASTEQRSLTGRETLIRSYDFLLKRYAPSSILVTGDGGVLAWFGAASMFVDTMNNLADWTVEEIVHPDLHFAINVAMEMLRLGELKSFSRRLTVHFEDGRAQPVEVKIEALDQISRGKIMLVVLTLKETESEVSEQVQGVEPVSREDVTVVTRRVQELERDLRLTEETLQHVTERLEASGEELQASNEELQASNEELQTSNEELQSSNEELHAVNEELISVSAEHERKIELLSELNATMEFVLDLMDTGVMFVGSDLRIKRFSQGIARVFKLESHDVGRTLDVVGPRLNFVDLPALAMKVMETDGSCEISGNYEGRSLHVSAHLIGENDTLSADNVLFLFRMGEATDPEA